MKRLLIGSIATASALLAATASNIYINELVNYLTSKPFKVDGKFYRYDFNKDGTIAYNEWVYIATANQKAYRLLATTPSQENAFGFAPIQLPSDLNSNPDGYFIKIDFPLDQDRRFSWVYVTNNGKVYKLMGATPQNTFDYLDIDGKPGADPLPLTYTFSSQLPGEASSTLTFIQEQSQTQTPSAATDTLSADQRYEIAWMWNEEKLAHDLYLSLYEKFRNEPQAKTLYNIATKSESQHMQAVQNLAQSYDVNVSEEYMQPYDPNLITSLGSGQFAITEIQNLYNDLYTQGSESIQEALKVGCIVEVTDVDDLNKALEVAANNDDMVNVFTFLRQGSYNHYWAFDRALKSIGVENGCCSLGEKFCKSVDEYPSSNQGSGAQGGGGKGHRR